MRLYTEVNMVIDEDLNVILDLKEKFGGSQMISKANIEFRDWVKENKLLEIPTSNGIFI